MRKLISLALVVAVAGSIAALAAGGTSRKAVKATPAAPLATSLAAARLATAKYVTNLARAKADGYKVITQMIPNMGWHFLNPKVTGFDVTKPAILVYEKRGGTWTLGALEWVFPSMPKTPPLPGAKYGAFGAACTTPTGRSRRPPLRTRARRRARRAARRSGSGIRTW